MPHEEGVLIKEVHVLIKEGGRWPHKEGGLVNYKGVTVLIIILYCTLVTMAALGSNHIGSAALTACSCSMLYH